MITVARFAPLAVRGLGRRRSRTALSILAIAVVVAVYVTLAGVAEGLDRTAGGAGSARNLILVDARTVLPDDGAIAPRAAAAAARIPGVSRVVPMLYRLVRIGTRSAHLRAVPVDVYERALEPSLLAGHGLKEADGVMVGEGLLQLNGWHLGDTLEIAGEPMPVTGVFRAEGLKNSELWVSLADGRRLLGRKAYSQVLVIPDPEADPEAVRAALEADPALAAVRVYFEQAYYQQSSRMLSQLRSVTFMVSVVALIAIVAGVFNSVSMTATEQRREVAVLKAIGVARRHITAVFVLQGLVLALAGLGLGLAGGAAVISVLRSSSALNLADVTVEPVLTPAVVAFGAGTTLLLGLVGAFLPARRAAAATVAAVLRE